MRRAVDDRVGQPREPESLIALGQAGDVSADDLISLRIQRSRRAPISECNNGRGGKGEYGEVNGNDTKRKSAEYSRRAHGSYSPHHERFAATEPRSLCRFLP